MTKEQLEELIRKASEEAKAYTTSAFPDSNSGYHIESAFRTGFYRGADAAIRMLEQKEETAP